MIMPFGRFKASPVALSDGGDQVLVGADLGRQLVAQHLDHIEAGQEVMRVAQCQALLGKEEMGMT
jgi:hypothetical protein